MEQGLPHHRRLLGRLPPTVPHNPSLVVSQLLLALLLKLVDEATHVCALTVVLLIRLFVAVVLRDGVVVGLLAARVAAAEPEAAYDEANDGEEDDKDHDHQVDVDEAAACNLVAISGLCCLDLLLPDLTGDASAAGELISRCDHASLGKTPNSANSEPDNTLGSVEAYCEPYENLAKIVA